MKYFSIIIGLCITFFALASCEDALREEPETFFNEEQLFATESGVESLVNGMYTAVYDPAYYGTSWHGLIAPLSGKFWSSQGVNQDATSLNTASNNTWLLRMWPQMYSAVNTTNVVIANLERSAVELDNLNSSLGQAYFLRAITYFDLVRLFGGVPLRLAPASIDDLHLPRSSKQAIYDQVIADLTRARDLLPAPGEYRPERPTNFTAEAYLARVYLTLASENNSTEFYQLAQTAALAAHNSGEYALTPTYAELFAFGNENTQEAIFEFQYGQTGGIRNSDVVRFYTPKNSTFVPDNVVTFGRIRPNKETFDDHVETYPGDPRIDASYVYDEYVKNNGSIQTIYPTRTGGNDGYAVLAKYFDPTYNGTTTSRNLLHFRYADLLLMLAEIENELNGPENAYAFVNQVLARARDTDGDGTDDVDQPADFSDLSQEEFRQKIRKERQFELMGEGHAWFDTRRFGYDYFLEEVVRKHNSHPTFDNRKDFVYPEDEKNMLLPLPLTEISGNQAIDASDQNPGY